MKKYELFIGIDISKKWFDVALTLDGEKAQMIHKQFSNDKKGFKAFLSWVKAHVKSNQLTGAWFCCMEHTGVYTLPLAVFLQEKAIDYVIESALRIKNSLGIRRGKSDKADSKDIAEYAFTKIKKLTASKLPVDKLMALKSMLTFRNSLVKFKTALNNSSGEYKAFMPDQFKVGLIINGSKQLIKSLNQQIKEVEKQMKQIIDQDPELKRLYDLVKSVKGVGPIIATTMLVYTNCFKAFDNARKFACYIGIAPFSEKSGISLNKPAKVSELANKKIKALIGNGVNSAIQNDKELNKYYQRKIADGKNKFKVLNAVKNKLIARIFAVVKRGTPYVELCNYA